MLSFRELSEKKTKIKINPRKEVMEGGCGTMPKMAKGGEVKRNHGEWVYECDKKRRADDLGDEYLQRKQLCQSRRSFPKAQESETETILTFKRI